MEETSAIITFFTSHDDVWNMVGYVLIPIVFIGTPVIAYRKGRNPFFWFIMALVLQPMALIAVLLMSKQKKCIHCGHSINEEFNTCPLCGNPQEELPSIEEENTK